MPDVHPAANDNPALFGWRRLRVALVAGLVLSLMSLPGWQASFAVLLVRFFFTGLALLAIFGLLERWPRRLPRWLARWALQVIGVAVAVPFLMAIAYAFTTFDDPAPWYKNAARMQGYAKLTVFTLLVAPWIAMASLYRHVSGEAQRQALAFALERSEFERNAVESRLHVLQAQVEPHFLFNTLANVRELVDSGSPQASQVLGHLIAYLRAAVPRLHDSGSTIAEEAALARAYLEVMHMRMPDRLQFTVEVDDAVAAAACPPMALLTLVENAVRHGIDPSEVGGRIDVRAQLREGHCHLSVVDTGIGLGTTSNGLGTGLSALRERLQLAFGQAATLTIQPQVPHGVRAEMVLPLSSRVAG